MTNGNHIPTEALFESARLNAELDAASQSHLQACSDCRTRLSWMERAAGLGSKEMEFEPPQSVMDTVLRLGRPNVFKQLRKFVTASLTFDSFAAPAAAGVRQSEATIRQMTFEADGIEIGISLRRSDNKWTLTGQVLSTLAMPIEDPAAHVDVVVEGDHVATSALSPWGEFVFADLPAAEYSLQVSIREHVVRISALPRA